MAEAKNEKAKVGSTKEHLKQLATDKVKIRFRDRIKCEILKDTQFYKKGQIINPHKVTGEKLIAEKIAKKIVEKD